MNKKTLGATVKEQRDALRFTQRELAAKVGVKASHIAYIENGFRKPSLSLLRRLADTLGLDPRELLLLAHPDAKYLMVQRDQPAPRDDDAWERFVSDRAMLRAHKVSRAELRVLKQVSLL